MVNFLICEWQYKKKILAGIADQPLAITQNFVFEQNYPNPFIPATTIKFSIPAITNVVLTVSNSIGEDIMTLINEEKQPGVYEVEFNGTTLANGIYYYKLVAKDFVQTKKMILIK